MSDERKRAGAGFWIILSVVTVMLLYPLSVGPAELLNRKGRISDETGNAIRLFYRPLDWAYRDGPESIRRALDWYMKFWR
jgi:hypothetical protein